MAKPKIPDEGLLRELTADPDGLPVRPIKPHSLKKLSVLLLYFKPFTQIVGGGYYVDGLAGPGICEVKDVPPPTRFVWGSPLLALRAQPGFERCWFVEIDRKIGDALGSRTSIIARRSEVWIGDVNLLVPSILMDEVPPAAPCFCFLDPEATEVHWATVAQVASGPGRNKMPEILVNFPLQMSFQRLLTTQAPMDAESVAKADRFFPGPEWREVHEAHLTGLSAQEASERYLTLYKRGLEGLGYKRDRIHSLLIRTPGAPGGKGHPLYHLVFATDHPKGSEIMDYVLKRQNWVDRLVMGQPSLLPPGA